MKTLSQLTSEEIQEICYLIEKTITPLVDIYKKYNISKFTLNRICKTYNVSRSKELKYESKIMCVKNQWGNRTTEEKHNIACKGNNKRKNTWNKKSDKEKEEYKKQHSDLSKTMWSNMSYEKQQQRSESIKASWSNKSKEQINQIVHKRKVTLSKKTQKELDHTSKLISQANKRRWSNKEYKHKVSKNIQKAWLNKSEDEMKEFKNKVSISQTISKSKRTKKQKALESERKSKAGKAVWANYTNEQLKHLSEVRSKNTTNIWNNRSQEEKERILNLLHTKGLKTQQENDSFGTSKAEDVVYDLLIEHYGKGNVKHQYRQDNMVFDFYVYYNNEITLIELNGVYWHNYKPFNNTDLDIKQYEYMKKQGKRSSYIADVWRYKDTNKTVFCLRSEI